MPGVQTDVGGLRAIELNFRPLRDISTGKSICYLTRTHLNTPGLGVLMPETFRPAAETYGKSKKLFPLEILQLAESLRDLNNANRVYDWFSIDMPLSILMDRAAAAVSDKICEQFALAPNKICFVIPEQVLVVNDPTAADNISRLRRLGYHVMLSSFGENGCPFLRLSELPVDYVLLSPYVTQSLGKSERTDQAVRSIIGFVNELQCEPLADGVQNSSQAESLYEFGCNYCAGPLSGDYVTLSDLLE